MKKLFLLITVLLMISACSTMQPPRYSISVDNIQILKQFEGARAEVTSFSQDTNFHSNCRLMGPIEPADGLTIPQFVSKAMNDEFKMANIYSNDGVRLSGIITKIQFSSITGVTNGYWDIGITLNSSNGQSFSVENRYTFKSGFDGITACNATADALAPAVQDLIKATVTHPDFGDLIKS